MNVLAVINIKLRNRRCNVFSLSAVLQYIILTCLQICRHHDGQRANSVSKPASHSSQSKREFTVSRYSAILQRVRQAMSRAYLYSVFVSRFECVIQSVPPPPLVQCGVAI